MKERFRRIWNEYYKPAYRVVAFVVAGIIMVLSFPNMKKFKYEYEIQRPWRYENIIAPFDFPIYKTDSELLTERDSIMTNFRPYYRRDTIDVATVATDVDNMLRHYQSKFTTICPQTVHADSVRNFVGESLTQALVSAYSVGIIESPETVEDTHSSSYELVLVTGNIQEPYELSELLTMREAYTIVVEQLKFDLDGHYGANRSWTQTLVDRMPINDLITANVVYDEARTNIERENRLARMSLSSGRMVAGQRIISTGDIVDRQTIKILDSLKKAYDTQDSSNVHTLPVYLGEILMIACLLTSVFLFLYFFRRNDFNSLHCVNFILLMMILMVVGTGVATSRNANICFAVPYVILPIMLRIFLDSRVAMYVHMVTVLIVSFLAFNSQQFIVLHFPAGMVAIISLVNMTRRSQILRSSLLVFITYSITYTGYSFWHSGEFAINWYIFVMFASNCVLVLLSYPLIYICERVFGFISDVTLVELSDTNHPLLRELSEKAPGTFQHSVQVGNLAQAVAYKIGANAMLVRTGAMYHDVGKIASPMYFTENQAGNINPHDGMDYEESAQIVIKHVANGVRIAKKHNIPQSIIDFIKTHHGDTMARYFYVAWCNEHKDQEPPIASFTYDGPTPQTKEEAILMMADAVEASSKSLKTYTDDAIDALVEKIVTLQVDQKQFRMAPITFRDIEIAKQVFKEKLKNIYRARIQYPELMK